MRQLGAQRYIARYSALVPDHMVVVTAERNPPGTSTSTWHLSARAETADWQERGEMTAAIFNDSEYLFTGEPAGTGVWLQNLKVHPEGRGKGLGRALNVAILTEAAYLGARHGLTDEHVSEAGEGTLKSALKQLGARYDFERQNKSRALATFAFWLR